LNWSTISGSGEAGKGGERQNLDGVLAPSGRSAIRTEVERRDTASVRVARNSGVIHFQNRPRASLGWDQLESPRVSLARLGMGTSPLAQQLPSAERGAEGPQGQGGEQAPARPGTGPGRTTVKLELATSNKMRAGKSAAITPRRGLIQQDVSEINTLWKRDTINLRSAGNGTGPGLLRIAISY
jgi:hypothetical protein